MNSEIFRRLIIYDNADDSKAEHDKFVSMAAAMALYYFMISFFSFLDGVYVCFTYLFTYFDPIFVSHFFIYFGSSARSARPPRAARRSIETRINGGSSVEDGRKKLSRVILLSRRAKEIIVKWL